MIDVDPHAPEAPATRRVRGLFAGLATLDIVSHVDRAPGPDEKVTATWQLVAAGGPALNAAVTFAALGGHALLLTASARVRRPTWCAPTSAPAGSNSSTSRVTG